MLFSTDVPMAPFRAWLRGPYVQVQVGIFPSVHPNGPCYLQMVRIPSILPAGKEMKRKHVIDRLNTHASRQLTNNVKTNPEALICTNNDEKCLNGN